MDFELSDDQIAYREAAAQLLGDLASSTRLRAHVTSGAAYDEKLWGAMVTQGWLDAELGFIEAVVLMEELGRHAGPAPFHQTLLALGALAGTDWVDRLQSGTVGAVAWDGTGRAERVLVPYAPVADVVVVATPDAVVAHDLTSGDRPVAESAMDVTRCVGWLPTGRPGATTVGGPAEAAALLDRGAVATSAETLGGSARVLEMAVEHAKERVQFGKPIGSFQAVKHRCADMLVDLEGMRSTVYHAAWSIAAEQPDASIAASTAKTWCADAGRRVMASGLQVHGGIGFTWEHDLHFFLKRAQLDQVTFGDAVAHRRRLADLLRARVLAGDPIV